jgi:hypothetical protein
LDILPATFLVNGESSGEYESPMHVRIGLLYFIRAGSTPALSTLYCAVITLLINRLKILFNPSASAKG